MAGLADKDRFDVIILGAGAAGMMCAIEAGKRGRRVLVLEHNEKPGEKIRISGGGRCNFTNTGTSHRNFLSGNSKFAISALSRFTPNDFLALLARYGIAWHEKTLGQLFCDGSAQQIIAMLLAEMRQAGATLITNIETDGITREGTDFVLACADRTFVAQTLVVASGGKSIPKMGASAIGYRIAGQFGINTVETRPALVPLAFDPSVLSETASLAGVAVDALVACGKTTFGEALLFTHRGLSGPAILQISSWWRPGDPVTINLAPERDVLRYLREERATHPKRNVATALAEIVPQKLAQLISPDPEARLADQSDRRLGELATRVNAWQVKPTGTEGYRTAEVTAGGVDTAELDAKTMQCRKVPGLYFIGEVVDVTGWLGGYNFQWAWASGWAAGQVA